MYDRQYVKDIYLNCGLSFVTCSNNYVSFTYCLSYMSILYGFITNSQNDQLPWANDTL